jgi:Tfp pilus assembly protein PilX
MNAPATLRAQRGATLVVGLIMLVLITLVVTSAFMLSTGNLRAVGNMQFRNEAIAAANAATEEVLNSLLTGGSTAQPPGQVIQVDINNDGEFDYDVTIQPPVCVRASKAAPGYSSSLALGKTMSTSSFWNTVWDIQADVDDGATSASVTVRQGVRVLLSESQKASVCP